jgi:predicted phage-related endonuclease
MITASCFGSVLCKGRGRKIYLRRLIAERLNGQLQNTYTSEAMLWGKEHEQYARKLYQRLNNVRVQNVGFVKYDEYIGCSPDGLVGTDGIIEIKCPNTSTHISYLQKDKLPPKYIPQVQGQLWITGRQWCDFISFDPRHKRKIHIVKVDRDDEYIAKLKIAVEQFKTELIAKISQPKHKKSFSKIQRSKKKSNTRVILPALCFWIGLIWFLGSDFYSENGKTNYYSLIPLVIGFFWYYATKFRF